MVKSMEKVLFWSLVNEIMPPESGKKLALCKKKLAEGTVERAEVSFSSRFSGVQNGYSCYFPSMKISFAVHL